MTTLINSTFVKSTEDHFAGIFSSPVWNYSMFLVYILGLLNCVSLSFISWFERSGQAGPFRTLRNRLVSFNVDQLILRYIIPGFAFNLRAIVGPLPGLVCKCVAFFNVFNGINLSLITLSITITKFVFICYFQSIPAMDDNLISLIIYSNILMNSFVITSGTFLLQTQSFTLFEVKINFIKMSEVKGVHLEHNYLKNKSGRQCV